jgi:hypothetical protein
MAVEQMHNTNKSTDRIRGKFTSFLCVARADESGRCVGGCSLRESCETHNHIEIIPVKL